MKINFDKDYILLKTRQTGRSIASINAMMDWYKLWIREERKRKVKNIFNI